MAAAFEFILNGRTVRIENCSPNTTLLEYLRSSGRTGTKEGCAEGDCGACSVAIVERDNTGENVFRAVNSCLIPLPALAGRTVVTVEGVANGSLHPVQDSMVRNYGSQCGYCTPGIVMSLVEAFHRSDLKTGAQINDQLCGNLCRCTGYRPIRDAAIEALNNRTEDNEGHLARLLKTGSKLSQVDYEALQQKFFRPASLTDLFSLLEKFPQARLVAGATELGLEITKKFRSFETLISLEAIPELTQLDRTENVWQIGAAVTLTRVEDSVAKEFPALAEMLNLFGSRQIRNRATLGGNLVTASPIGDSAPVLLTLQARVVLASKRGERIISLDEFFIGYRKTALQSGEILKTIIVPRNQTARTRFFKVSKRREMDISTVAGCFSLEVDSKNTVRSIRIAYGGVAPTTVRARATEQFLTERTWTEETVRAALPILAQEFTPISDVRGSAEYRQQMITGLFEKFFYEPDSSATPNPAKQAPCSIPTSIPHESAHKHVTGEAVYTDDSAARRKMLEVWPVCSPHAKARILKRDASAARSMPGVHAVLLAEDVPGLNDVGAVRHDEVLFADKEVLFHGHIVALVVGETQAQCRAAATAVVVEYEPLTPVFTIHEAIETQSFHTDANFIHRGDAASVLLASPMKLHGEFSFGGQEHFYLEMQAAWAETGEDGSAFVMSSTQHPSEVQHIVSHVLHVPVNKVVVQSPRMGGGFGGKETQAATFAALAALASAKTRQPVRVRINRDLDMMLTGKRHPFLAKFDVGFTADGDLLSARVELFSNGGWSLDLSMPVTDRALFHLDNCYYIPNVEFSGRVAKTNLASNTAFRGFGGPQGMLVMEEILDRIARQLNLPPEQVRERNLYRGQGETNTTHYGQEIEDNRIQRIWHELKSTSRFDARREEIQAWNGNHPHHKRGLAITPVKFGISFTLTHLNQAGSLVLIYQDGTVQVNHGGTEMGQGIHTNIAMVAAKELGINVGKIRVMPTSTDKVPNTSATAASSGTDLNGAAVKNACETLRARLAPVAARILGAQLKQEISPDEILFESDCVFHARITEAKVAFTQVVQQAYFERVSLSSTGYYRTPEIHYNRSAGKGKPFHYFAVGAAVTEVEIDGFTGMCKVLRTDILHDVGDSINPGINRGQIEGGFVQGMGWLTSEELLWDAKGGLLTHSPDTYKIPAISDAPAEFNVAFLSNATQRNTIHGSKAIGEPPFMLAISVREAIRDAIAAFGNLTNEVPLASPSTSEAIFKAIQTQRSMPKSVKS